MRYALPLPLLVLLSCHPDRPAASYVTQRDTPVPEATATDAAARAAAPAALKALEAELVHRHGEGQRARIARGLAQVASLWRPGDGDLGAFARQHFIASDRDLEATLQRLEVAFEQLDGHLLEIGREWRRSTDTDVGPLLTVDPLLAAYDPSAHVLEDLFRGKIAFVVLLNFPLTTLRERIDEGREWSRRRWAEARLAGRFSRRVPGDVQQRIAAVAADHGLYIAEYNIWMHHLLTPDGERPWPAGLKLISHWNLRDELRAQYADPKGLGKQRIIAKVMERIVTQTIPQVVINNPRVDWEPFANTVKPAPEAEIEAEAPSLKFAGDPGARENDVRYARLLQTFGAQQAADPYSPSVPTLIARSFELQREMPEERVEGLLRQVCGSPLARRVAALIEQRLGRRLEPHDLWYHGFRARGRFPEGELDAITRRRYPTAAAFQKDIPNILRKLGFTADRARFLSNHIIVEAARGAGHAMEARRRGDFPRLRTRVGKDGMDYKGYNIAVHELGHNVEQVLSLYGVDHTLLQGVPNNAFTEAIAFVFQSRDLELLGLAKPTVEAEPLRVLNDFWMTWEIAGVALVDMAVWHWMYDHPQASAAELRQAVISIAQRLWDQYYAPVLGGTGVVLLGIYSHMIQETLYLPDYPLGHLIAFQIEEHLKQKGGSLGAEIERMVKYGALLPDLWMEHATGAPVSAQPLFKAVEAALTRTEK